MLIQGWHNFGCILRGFWWPPRGKFPHGNCVILTSTASGFLSAFSVFKEEKWGKILFHLQRKIPLKGRRATYQSFRTSLQGGWLEVIIRLLLLKKEIWWMRPQKGWQALISNIKITQCVHTLITFVKPHIWDSSSSGKDG